MGSAQEFGARLRQARLAVRLSQEELAARTGLSVRAIGDLERGRTRHPYPRTLRLLAEVLSLDEPAAASPEEPAAGVPETAGAVPRQLPAGVRHFVGRAGELRRLTALLDTSGDRDRAVVISAIGGTAGIGKTALALHWSHQVRDRFPDGQLYVNLAGYGADPPLPAADALAGFLYALDVPDSRIPSGLAERAAAYRSLVAGRRMLVVLDNAERSEQVRPLLPGTAGCFVLVTSRDALAGLVARDGAVRLDLDVLPPAGALTLLRELIGARVDEDPAAAATLAERCSRLPLALRVAAELAAGRPAVPVAALTAELADLQDRLDVLDAHGDEDTAVRAVFSWSYRHLDPVSAEAFRSVGLHPGPDLDRYALAALLDAEPRAAGRLLAGLCAAHLVHPAGSGRYGMHDLLRGYARELARAEDGPAGVDTATRRLFDWYVHTAAAALDTLFPAESSRRPRLGPYRGPSPPVGDGGTARAWLDAERPTLIAMAARSADGAAPAGQAITLSAVLERYLSFGWHLPEAAALHGYALRAARRAGDRHAEATALTHLGLLEWVLGRSRPAVEYQRRALRLFETAGNPAGTWRALHRLALAERLLGDLDQAAAHAVQAIALTSRNGDRLGEARARQCLGSVRFGQGRFAEAGELFARVLELLDELGDRNSRSVAVTALAILDLRYGRLVPAGRRLEAALALCRAAGNSDGAAAVLSHLGVLRLRRGEPAPAVRLQREALALFRAVPDRHGEAEVLVRLAAVTLATGRVAEVVEHLEAALRIARSLDARPVETDALAGLGDAMLAAGRPLDAAAHFTTALVLAGRTGDRDAQARSRYGLARTYQAQGDRARSHRYLRAALAFYAETAVPEADLLRELLAGAHRGPPALRRQISWSATPGGFEVDGSGDPSMG